MVGRPAGGHRGCRRRQCPREVAGQIGGQALRLGLVDQVVMHVVPVVFGSGRPFFGTMGAGDVVPFDNPARVVQGDRVTHLLYDVSRPPA
ncbi:hypothetical protein [Micromonospora sp. WP24]|uniref:hypothetical protein n=1 Tax=Micromonospora sp. WP24 TaxID=2604469 RepID=UPI0011DE4A68|nr:hypothetical protein [Micromonospora sp. WP24]